MTNRIIKALFWAYQGITNSRTVTCRYLPTCSKYAVDAIEKYGLPKGSYLSAKRILSCHPFSKRNYYDPA